MHLPDMYGMMVDCFRLFWQLVALSHRGLGGGPVSLKHVLCGVTIPFQKKVCHRGMMFLDLSSSLFVV
jgi:hypothetical protein